MNITAIAIGIMKWSAKNRVRVGCLTENPPHIHSTKLFPRIGIAEKMLVITVAPQKDICPHGRTYPKNAVAITRTKITIPDSHTCFFVEGELNRSPRAMWIYMRVKNNDAPLAWVERNIHPMFTSRVRWEIDSKEVFMSVEKYMARISPVTICETKQNLSMEPMFHA